MTEPKQNSAETIDDLLQENRQFPSSSDFRAQANISDPGIYEKAIADPETFWADWVSQLQWQTKWDRILEWNAPYSKWFVGGKLNASENCLDRHLETRGSKRALVWEGEPGDTRTLTYTELHAEVSTFANVLKGLGVEAGDRVAIYLPLIPEAVISMLACARIGAVHSVVFGGFSSEALRDRIVDAEAKLLITATTGYRRGNVVPLKKLADDAIVETPTIQNVVVVRRRDEDGDAAMKENRDRWYHDLMRDASADCAPTYVDSEHMLYTLYTSGTTGKPKGIVHTTGGYLTGVYATTKWVSDLKEEDVYWCTADVGWVTGHSYVVYGPLANGATVFIYEGAPDWPERDRFWQLIEKHKVTIFYTAPTAIRAFMKWGHEHATKHDLSTLRLLGSVGEPINPEAWIWYHKYIGGERCPVVDTWWQTETGAIMITPLPGITATKPGSATKPFPGIDAAIFNERGEPVEQGGGYLVVKSPWPSMLRGIYKDPQRFESQYWSKWKGIYFTGDGAKLDEDGFFWLLGRVDDVINVAGHRIGTMEVESALVDHPSVAEAAVVGINHEIKGTAIAAFVIIKESRREQAQNNPEAMIAELKEHVVQKIGAIARPEKILITADLPKTRSGKIMRRLLRDVAEGRALGDVTTLADPAVVSSLKERYEEQERSALMFKTALITGGARGIGRVTAMRLLSDGYNVAFTYFGSRDAAKSFEEEMSKHYLGHDQPDIIALEADTRDHARAVEVADAVVAKFGTIDALVNNAGVRNDTLMYNMTREQWEDVIDTNLGGTFSMTQAVLKVMMKQRQGAIVNVTSLSALHGVAGQTNYAASKGGIVAMTRALARETARSGIRVNCVAPGLVETDMIAELPDEVRKEMIRSIPMRRVIAPAEVASTIAFLLSDDASAITGQVICVDGGTSA